MPTRWLGSVVRCKDCLAAIVPYMPQGAAYPPSGYELRYGDFVTLLQSGEATMQWFLTHRFGYANRSTRELARVLNAQQEAIDPIWLHERIQDSSTLQRELYDIAMSLWR